VRDITHAADAHRQRGVEIDVRPASGSRVVDEVPRPAKLSRTPQSPVHGLAVGDVGGHRNGLSVAGLQAGDRAVDRSPVEVPRGDPQSDGCRVAGGGGADPAPGASHDHDVSGREPE